MRFDLYEKQHTAPVPEDGRGSHLRIHTWVLSQARLPDELLGSRRPRCFIDWRHLLTYPTHLIFEPYSLISAHLWRQKHVSPSRSLCSSTSCRLELILPVPLFSLMHLHSLIASCLTRTFGYRLFRYPRLEISSDRLGESVQTRAFVVEAVGQEGIACVCKGLALVLFERLLSCRSVVVKVTTPSESTT